MQARFAKGYEVDELTRVMTAKLYWQNKGVFGKPAIQQNGKLEDKPGKVGKQRQSTKAEIVEFLNALARRVQIDKRPGYPQGYLATERNIG